MVQPVGPAGGGGFVCHAPRATKHAAQARDPAMHQTKNGNQHYFGMKAHIGVDGRSKAIHAVVATAANAGDATALPDLIHGDGTRVWADQAYRGQREVIGEASRRAMPRRRGEAVAGLARPRRPER